LVVDDEAPTREVLAQAVRRLGFQVVTASDGVDALEKLRAAVSPFRLILMDLTMPRMDGLETARQIRRTHPDLPVVLMTGFAEDAISPALQELELAAFFQKPFTMTALQSKLAEVLGEAAET
jgi:CheY-like chemotaxis protein